MEKAGTTTETTYLFEDANHAVVTGSKIGLHVCALSDYSMRDHVDEVKAHAELYLDDFTDLQAIQAFIGE
jgi:hypothetical protein